MQQSLSCTEHGTLLFQSDANSKRYVSYLFNLISFNTSRNKAIGILRYQKISCKAAHGFERTVVAASDLENSIIYNGQLCMFISAYS